MKLDSKLVVGPLLALVTSAWLSSNGAAHRPSSSLLNEVCVSDLVFDGLHIGDDRNAVLKHWGSPSRIEPHELARFGGEEEQRYQLWRYAGNRSAMLRDDLVVTLSIDSGSVTCSGHRLPGPGDRGDDIERTFGPPLPNEYAADHLFKIYETGDGTGGLYYELEAGLIQKVTVGREKP